MGNQKRFKQVVEGEFSAHNTLLNAAQFEISSAEQCRKGSFYKCLAAMIMTAIAVEAFLNAVGKRVVVQEAWDCFEWLKPYQKIDSLVEILKINRKTEEEPWPTLRYLQKFRNDIVHAKPEKIYEETILSEVGLVKTAFDKPLSRLEKEVTLENAKRVYKAVEEFRRLLTDAMPEGQKFGIDADMSCGSTTEYKA